MKEIWSDRGNKKFAGVGSILIHGGIIALLIFISTLKPVQQAVRNTVTLVAPDLAPFEVAAAKKLEKMGGGGGGGDRSPLPASQGKLPRSPPVSSPRRWRW